jgi:hypothetical protein
MILLFKAERGECPNAKFGAVAYLFAFTNTIGYALMHRV